MLERAEAELQASRDVIGGPLAIAGFATSVRGLAPHALVDLRTRHPQLQPVLRELEPADALPLLVRRELDLVIAQDWANAPLALPDGLNKAPLVDDIADIALPASHRLARQRTVRARRSRGGAVDHLAQGFDLPRLADSHAAAARPRAAHRAHRVGGRDAAGAGRRGPGAAVIPRLGRGKRALRARRSCLRADAAASRVRALAAAMPHAGPLSGRPSKPFSGPPAAWTPRSRAGDRRQLSH